MLALLQKKSLIRYIFRIIKDGTLGIKDGNALSKMMEQKWEESSLSKQHSPGLSTERS
jgi:hypothetical protein